MENLKVYRQKDKDILEKDRKLITDNKKIEQSYRNDLKLGQLRLRKRYIDNCPKITGDDNKKTF